MDELAYVNHYLLTAGECNPEQQLPVTLAAARIIETATEHANLLGVEIGRASCRERVCEYV